MNFQAPPCHMPTANQRINMAAKVASFFPHFSRTSFAVRLQLCKRFAAEQRVKQIILQPCPQSNVPAAPELLNGFGEKGPVKILGKRNPQRFRQTDDNIHAAGKSA